MLRLECTGLACCVPPDRMRAAVAVLVFGIAFGARSAAAAEPAILQIDAAGPTPQTITVGGNEEHVGATCVTPCSMSLAPGTYFVTGKARGVLSTQATITVPAGGTHVTLRGDRRAGRVWGIVLLSYGGAATLVGGIFLGGVLSSGVDDGYNQMFAVMAGVVLASGIGTGVPGFLLLRSHHGGIDVQRPLAPAPATTPASPKEVAGFAAPRSFVPTLTLRF